MGERACRHGSDDPRMCEPPGTVPARPRAAYEAAVVFGNMVPSTWGPGSMAK